MIEESLLLLFVTSQILSACFMIKNLTIILLLLLLPMCDQPKVNWINLLDEDLSKWDTYLSYRHKLGYNGEIPTDEEGKEVLPIGLNSEGFNVFSMIKENNENITIDLSQKSENISKSSQFLNNNRTNYFSLTIDHLSDSYTHFSFPFFERLLYSDAYFLDDPMYPYPQAEAKLF